MRKAVVRSQPAIYRNQEAKLHMSTDVCIVGAGLSGIAAAITLAEQGRDVILADALPVIGGQAVNSLIGLFCGVFGTGPNYPLLTKTIFEELFADLDGTRALSYRYGDTLSVQYDEIAVGRWLEKRLQKAGVRLLVNVVAREVYRREDRLESVDFASRYGELRVEAQGFIDSSGDATLTWLAGFGCHLPDNDIYGSQQFRLEGINLDHAPTREEVGIALRARGDNYQLRRREGIPFYFPGTDSAVINMTHVPSSMSVTGVSQNYLEGKEEADRVVRFLKDTFPKAFGDAFVSTYGFPGRRQTRWIQAEHTLTTQEVVEGYKFRDAIGRTAWPIELHDKTDSHLWEVFTDGHLHYIPLACMIPLGSTNLVAAGRCVDGEPAALSSIRVLGPCAAMGAGAAHALDLTLGGSIQDIDISALTQRVRMNIGDSHDIG